MKPREITGLILVVIALAIAPFGYWLSYKWGLVALAFGTPGAVLLFTKKTAKNCREDTPDTGPSRELKGFNGAEIFDQDDD